MSASSKAAERDPLLPYTRQFGSINEDDDDDDGKRLSEEAPHRTTSKTEKEDVLPLRRAFARGVEDENARVFIRFNGVRVVLLRRDRWFLLLVL